jgi:choline monooxygenase
MQIIVFLKDTQKQGMDRYYVDPDITIAETLPASFYKNPHVFDQLKEKVFYQSHQWVGDELLVPVTESVYPFVLLEGFLNEPMVLSRDKSDKIHCLSNVCTHRANLVVQGSGKTRQLVCGYHGRKFGLDGSFQAMPEFKEAREFPRDCDSLFEFPLSSWGPFLFADLGASQGFDQVIKAMDEKVGFMPLHQFKHDKNLSKSYMVNGHWALYCDNYLEGFHIPFVHDDLSQALDYGSYESVIGEQYNLQIGYAKDDTEVFELPDDHVDFGKRVAAYYFWIFPNMMFNFYPWGLSINIVKPISIDQTKVDFLTYIYDHSRLDKSAGALLDKVEREDEFVVEGVHHGLKSKYYSTGRFSPTREQNVHHFHRLLAESIS